MEAKLLFEHHRVSGHQDRSSASVADDVTPRVEVQHLHAGSASASEMDHRLGNLEQLSSRSYDNSTSILARPAALHQGLHYAPFTKVQTRGRSVLQILTKQTCLRTEPASTAAKQSPNGRHIVSDLVHKFVATPELPHVAHSIDQVDRQRLAIQVAGKIKQ